MANGEIRKAVGIISERGGRYSGKPSSILRATGFHGSWMDFCKGFPGSVIGDPESANRFIVTCPDFVEPTEDQEKLFKPDPEIWATVAAEYVLGDENRQTIIDFTSEYPEHTVVIGALAASIDDRIGAIFYPPETDRHVEVYRGDRSLYYSAGDGIFSIVGCWSLANEVRVA